MADPRVHEEPAVASGGYNVQGDVLPPAPLDTVGTASGNTARAILVGAISPLYVAWQKGKNSKTQSIR